MKSSNKSGGNPSAVTGNKQIQGAQNPSVDFGAPHGRAMDNKQDAISKLTPPSGMPGAWTGASGKTGGK